MYIFFFKQKTAYEMRISDWSSDVCSSDLTIRDRYGVGDGWIVGILADLRHQPRKGGGWLDTLREPLPLTRPSESALGVQRPYSGAGFVLWRSGAGRCWISVPARVQVAGIRSEEHTSELQSLMRISYAVFCLNKKKKKRQ